VPGCAVLVGKRGCLGSAERCSGASRCIVSGVCAARGGCARFRCHLLSPDVTSGVRAAGGVLMAEPMGAICR